MPIEITAIHAQSEMVSVLISVIKLVMMFAGRIRLMTRSVISFCPLAEISFIFFSKNPIAITEKMVTWSVSISPTAFISCFRMIIH